MKKKSSYISQIILIEKSDFLFYFFLLPDFMLLEILEHFPDFFLLILLHEFLRGGLFGFFSFGFIETFFVQGAIP